MDAHLSMVPLSPTPSGHGLRPRTPLSQRFDLDSLPVPALPVPTTPSRASSFHLPPNTPARSSSLHHHHNPPPVVITLQQPPKKHKPKPSLSTPTHPVASHTNTPKYSINHQQHQRQFTRREIVQRQLGYIKDLLQLAAVLFSIIGLAVNSLLLSTSLIYYKSSMAFNIFLLLTSFLTFFWLSLIRLYMQQKRPTSVMSTKLAEFISLFILFTLYLSALALLSTTLPNLSSCSNFPLCDQSKAAAGLGWTAWICLLFTLPLSAWESSGDMAALRDEWAVSLRPRRTGSGEKGAAGSDKGEDKSSVKVDVCTVVVESDGKSI
ncbi:hypothetical protein T439DRAFT_358917 [Meredithblackwellia eburnea MCA 4105]